jgi:hypothetical protein
VLTEANARFKERVHEAGRDCGAGPARHSGKAGHSSCVSEETAKQEADLRRVRLTMNRATSAWTARLFTGNEQKEAKLQTG